MVAADDRFLIIILQPVINYFSFWKLLFTSVLISFLFSLYYLIKSISDFPLVAIHLGKIRRERDEQEVKIRERGGTATPDSLKIEWIIYNRNRKLVDPDRSERPFPKKKKKEITAETKGVYIDIKKTFDHLQKLIS